MVLAIRCDVWRGDVWEEIGIDEALPIRSEYLMRCCECHGRVRAHKKANNGKRAHFEHRIAHKGYRRSTKFSGTQSRHPDAFPDKPTRSNYKRLRSTRAPT